jgi:preprotein translocase subunit SecD
MAGIAAMHWTHVILAAVVATSGCGSAWAGEEIALSFVHKQGRVDVPVSAIRRIEPHVAPATVTAVTGKQREFSLPHVEVCFTRAIHQEICRLTRRFIEEEPVEIVVGCKLVSRPVVREPLCSQPCFQISVNDFGEAKDLADTLRSGTEVCTSPSS